jgi:drug/metabolite transporter (DMT)-like permease
VGLSAAGLVLGAVGPVLTVVRQDSGTEPAVVVVPVLLAVGAMIAGGVTALVARFRHGERSVLVLLALPPGLPALSLLIGEFVFPHWAHRAAAPPRHGRPIVPL